MKWRQLQEHQEHQDRTGVVVNESIGGSVAIYLLDLQRKLAQMNKKNKPIDEMMPDLILLSALKIYTENFRKVDTERKVMLKLLGFRSSTPIPKMLGRMFRRASPTKAKELIKVNMFDKSSLDIKKVNQWISDIRQIIIAEETQLHDYITSVNHDANKILNKT